MEFKRGFLIHTLMLIIGGITECMAVKHFTVVEGDTLVLSCLRKNSRENVHMEWRNPNGHVMFFNNEKGLRDTRSNMFHFDISEYTIHLSNVNLKDQGVYKCLIYDDKVISKRYKVKVLARPKIETNDTGDKIEIKCSAAANLHPPELSWQMSGIEIEAIPNNMWESRSNKTMSFSVLKVKTHVRKATVKCLAKYKDLDKPLVDFIIIENRSITDPTSSYSITRDESKKETMKTSTSAPLVSSTTYMELSSVSEDTEPFSTGESTTPESEQEDNFTATEIDSLTTHDSMTATSSVSNSSEEFSTSNNTEGVRLEDGKHDLQNAQKESSPLLVMLVTCLIVCLLIVVIFFVIKVRRAHLAWKKENEDSDPSEESSKSKSSHEDKQSKDRRRQGFWNSNFTVYREETSQETPQRETSSNAAVEVISEAQDSTPSTTPAIKPQAVCIKETEL